MAVPTTNITMQAVYTEIHGSSGSNITLASLVADSNLADKTAPHDLNAFSGYIHGDPIPPIPTGLSSQYNTFSQVFTMDWANTTNATNYNIIYEHSDSTPELYNRSSTTSNYGASEFLCGTPRTCYWKVRAGNQSGWSNFSQVQSGSVSNCF